MEKINFYNIDKEEKIAIFQAIAAAKGMSSFAVEKDWWVSKTLKIIFQMEIAKHMVFKGGTSLSKAWKLIHRFSEDIDLAIDKEFFLMPQKEWSKKEITDVRKKAGVYITGEFFEDLKVGFEAMGVKDLKFNIVEVKDSDQDPRILEIFYPNVIAMPSEYILPRVQVEIGCRALHEPCSMITFGSLVDEVYIDMDFAEPLFSIPTVNAERTFLEKLFLLHEEFHRPADKRRVDRLSRHLYDIYYLERSGIADRAINDKDLYETIVAHRNKFNHVGGVNYNNHNPITLDPMPPSEIIGEWEDDYAKMMEDMIYEEQKPTFEDLIQNIKDIKVKLQSLDWQFSLTF